MEETYKFYIKGETSTKEIPWDVSILSDTVKIFSDQNKIYSLQFSLLDGAKTVQPVIFSWSDRENNNLGTVSISPKGILINNDSVALKKDTISEITTKGDLNIAKTEQTVEISSNYEYNIVGSTLYIIKNI